MSIGYEKVGYFVDVEVKKGDITTENISLGVVPVTITLNQGFGSYSIPAKSEQASLLGTINIYVDSIGVGETLTAYVKVKNGTDYETSGYFTLTKFSDVIKVVFPALSFQKSYDTHVSLKFAVVSYDNSNYFKLFTEGKDFYGNLMYSLNETGFTQGILFDFDMPTIYGFPYGDGESTSQGGQGEMSDTSDPIEIDSKPLLTTGDFLRVYKLTASDLTALRNKLISDGFLDGLISKLRTDAMDYIVGLNAIPISASNVASSTIKIANLDTEINASYLSWYIEDIDFGEIALTEYFQTFMDYSPYTKLSVYIPYCGIVPLNVDNFMNDKISMKCRVDMLTGQFVVFVSNSLGVITTVSGSCAYQLPVRANDYNRLVTSGLGLLGGIVGTAGALATGNIPLAIGAGIGTVGGLVATSQAMTKPDVTSKGSLGGNYGLLGNRTPYLIIQRPTISVPSDYGKTIGYMSRITAKLGDLTGYTVVEEVHLEHISATDDEKKLIENALKSGVIL